MQNRHIGVNPALDCRIAHRHFACNVTEQAATDSDDDGETLHKLEQHRRSENHQWNTYGKPYHQQRHAALGCCGNPDDVIQTHHQIGDEDGLDGCHKIAVRFDVLVTIIRQQQLDADPD